MKTILCYGDSNTWGYNAAGGARYPIEQRWTTVLARELGPEFTVIAEGLNGRTTVWPDPVEGEYKNGKQYLIPCLESHHPIDLVALMLGTNDLKHRYGLSAWDIASGVGALVEIIRRSEFGPDGGPPEVLLMASPITCVGDGPFKEMLAGADEKSRQLGAFYRLVAQEHGAAFLDTSTLITSDPTVGIHFPLAALETLGKAVAVEVHRVLA